MVISVKTVMTALADEVREMSGQTGTMTVANMTEHLVAGNVEIAEQTEIINQIIQAVNNLPDAGGGGGSFETLAVTIESQGWQPIQSVYSTHYTEQDGLHPQKNEWLSSTFVELQDVMCGSLVVLQTAQFYTPAYDMTDGVELMWNYNGQIFVFSLPQNPTGDITITLIEND